MKTKTSIFAALICGLTTVSSHAVGVFGLGTNGVLYSFDTTALNSFTTVGTPGNGIVDIDFRGSNGKLYGIAGSGETFTVNLLSGAATSVFTPATALNGVVTGFDVNPMADRFRVTTDALSGNNNYRLSATGLENSTTTLDGAFRTPTNAGNTVILDVAYLNPFNGSAGTALYSIGADGNLYQHFTDTTTNPSTPDPAGSFNGRTSSGSLGLGPISASGGFAFDIAQAGNTGYFSIGTSFYSISNVGTTTPSVTSLGTLAQPLASFSVVPEPSSAVLACLMGLTFFRRRRA